MDSQFEILEDIATGKPVDTILESLVNLVEAELPGSRCSILLVDERSAQLRLASAPNLPKSYNESVDGLCVGPNMGSCGTAAFLGEAVFVADISTDLRWEKFRDLAETHGLMACWSTPILAQRIPSPGGKRAVLGTFAVYPNQKGLPDDELIPWLERAQHLACVALETDRINRALKDSETRFRNVVDHAADSIFLTTTEGEIVDLNRKACEVLQRDRSELIGSTPAKFVMKFEPEGEKVNEPLFSGGERTFESVFQRKDGTTFPVEIRSGCFSVNGDRLCVGVVRDISERRRAEAVRQRQNQLMEKTQALAGLGSFEWELASDQITWSNILYDIYGLDPKEFEPTLESFFSKIHSDDREALQASIQGALANRSTFQNEERIIRPDGSLRVLESVGTVECDLQGNPTHILGACLDITERRNIEKHLAESQKMEAVGRLAGGIAHDFNNLLMVINGQAELLEEGLLEPQATKDALDDILEAGRMAASLTAQLLAFSRHRQVEPSVVDLNELVRDSLKLTARLVGENIEIVTDLGQSPAPCRVDKGQLEQIVMNLIVNARDAMPKGGKILVKSNSDLTIREGTSPGTGVPSGRYVELRVDDNGSGISEDVLPSIFEPFFTTKEMGRGTGLGLAVVHGVVNQWSGHLEVLSEENVGTSFRVLFPRVEDESVRRLLDPGHTNSERGSGAVLVVEDEDSVRKLVVRILEKEGYRVLQAENYDAAVKIADSENFDILLTDVVMPGRSGIDLLKYFRESRPDLPVLLMSGYTGQVVGLDIENEKAIDFLAKPFSLAELRLCVRRLLAQSLN